MNITKFCFFSLFLILTSRLVTSLGFSKLYDFINFPLILIAFLFHFPVKERFDKNLLTLILLFIILTFISALFNNIALITFVISVLIYMSPFIFFICLSTREWSDEEKIYLKNLIFIFIIFNLIIGYFQFFVLGLTQDQVKGLFLNLGAGPNLVGFLGISFIILAHYFFKNMNPFYSIFIIAISLGSIIIADAKIVLLVSLISWLVIIFINYTTFKNLIKNISLFSVAMIIIFFLINYGILPLPSVLYVDGFLYKFSPLIDFYNQQGFLQSLVGFGPGTTLSRTAIEATRHEDLLFQLGHRVTSVTRSLYAQDISTLNYFSGRGVGTTLFSWQFSWCGLFGDLGFFGLISYFVILLTIYKKYCKNFSQKFYIISIFFYGLIYNWAEEPIFMILSLSIVALISQVEKVKQEELIEVNKSQSAQNTNK